MDWFKKKHTSAGSVLFRGSLAPRMQEFAGLTKHGFQIEPGTPRANAHWVMRMKHPKIGQAEVVCLRDMPMPPRELVLFDASLSHEEKLEILAAGSAVSLLMEGSRDHLLRDRKLFLIAASRLMGKEGLAVLDHEAQRFWSRGALAEELSHPADLDVSGLFNLHVISDDDETAVEGQDEPPPFWFHTHGLSSIGVSEINVLNPSEDFISNGQDIPRVIAFSMLEGKAKVGGDPVRVSTVSSVSLIDASVFKAKAKPSDAPKWFDSVDDSHIKDNAIVCEPAPSGLTRLFRSSSPRPARSLSEGFPEQMMVFFSNEATLLMGERSRGTLGLFKRLITEFEEFRFEPMIKIGFRVDDGDETDREHIWMKVDAVVGDEFDATLQNQPFNVSRLKMGQRLRVGAADLTEWNIMTPFGTISPHFTGPARKIACRKDEVRVFMAEFWKQMGTGAG